MYRLRNATYIIIFLIVMGLVIQLIRTNYFITIEKGTSLLPEEVYSSDKDIMEHLDSDSVERVLVVYDAADENMVKLYDNSLKVLDYMKLSHETVLIDDFFSIDAKYDYVLFVGKYFNKIKNTRAIQDYIFEGGKMYFPFRLELDDGFNSIYKALGIIEFDNYDNFEGLLFYDDFMINSNSFEDDFSKMAINNSVKLQLHPNAVVSMETKDKTKLFWTYKYGKGEVAYFNGTILAEKSCRGIYASVINSIRDIKIYPMINSKVVFLDDFPAPIPNGTRENIYNEFNRTTEKFYKEIWWPDMMEISSRLNIIHTAVIIGTYDDETDYVTENEILIQKEDLLYFGREILSSGGELGLHGYNHQPLTLDKSEHYSDFYIPWPNMDTMKESVAIVNLFFNKVFPEYRLISYVPPSNVLSEDGRNALIESGILIISSLYTTFDLEEAYEQEFEIKDGVVEFPRFTSGHFNTEEQRWFLINGMNLHGVFSHFIHPDDLLDPSRSGDLPWSKLYDEYYDLHRFVFNTYKWNEPQTVSDASRRLIDYYNNVPSYEKTKDGFIIRNTNVVEGRPLFFVYRTEEEVEKITGGKIQKIDSNKYIVEVHEEECKIQLKR